MHTKLAMVSVSVSGAHNRHHAVARESSIDSSFVRTQGVWPRLWPLQLPRQIFDCRLNRFGQQFENSKMIIMSTSRSCRRLIDTVLKISVSLQKSQSMLTTYDRGEPAVSYRWIGWVWGITGWSSRLLQETYRSYYRNLWNIAQFYKRKPEDVNM